MFFIGLLMLFRLFGNGQAKRFDKLQTFLEFRARQERILRDAIADFDSPINGLKGFSILLSALSNGLLDAKLFLGCQRLRISRLVKRFN